MESITITRSTYYPIVILLLLLISCGNPNNRLTQEPLADDSVTPRVSAGDTIDETAILAACRNFRARYSADSEEGRNWRRFRAGFLRTETFDRALITYWEIENVLPAGENAQEVINILQERKLIPFWPTDPETGEKIRIATNPEDIFGYSDIYVSLGSSGAFDYVLEYYHNSPPFTPYVDLFELSPKFIDLQRVNSIGDSGETFTISDNPSEAFRRMVQLYFEYMMHESFMVLDGRVPETLGELLSGRMTINNDGWGHPAESVQDGGIGDFEFGVDPSLNAYYFIYVSSEGETIQDAFEFTQSQIAGELVYDTTAPHADTDPVLFDELQIRIPLLTDDMFSGPPPEI